MAVRKASSALRGVLRIALEQDLASDAVQKRVSPAFSRLAGNRESFVDTRQRCFGTVYGGFDLGKQAMTEWQ